MTKTRLAIAAMVAAGLAGSPVAYAKTYKHPKHHASTTTGTSMKSTTGANMKSSSMKSSGGSSSGNVGPGTNNNNGPQPGGR